jgi:hypothetical protein
MDLRDVHWREKGQSPIFAEEIKKRPAGRENPRAAWQLRI